MNYKSMLKGALALSLGLIVGTASATTTTQTDALPAYEETFEAVAVTNGMPITDAQFHALDGEDSNKPYGWLASEGDESKVIAGGPTGSTKALQLNTDAGTLTNQFQKSVRDSLNDGIDGTAGAGAYIETEVKFVPSDTLDAGITGGTDATKFAIYAYADDNASPGTTNLVVFHKYIANGVPGYTNEQFGAVNCDVYTKLRVEMKQVLDPSSAESVNVFCVKVNDGAALTSPLAFADGIWFLTAEYATGNLDNMKVSSLNFKGTGEIDNVKAGVITTTTTYDVTFKNGDTTLYATNYAAGETAVYVGATPTKAADGTYTYEFSGWDPALGTVNADTIYTATFTATPIAGGDDYDETNGDTVNGEAISPAVAAWLNGIKGNATKADFEETLDNDGYTLTEEYLLNTDPTVDTTVAFNITSIAVGNTVDLQVTLTRTEGNEAVAKAINGELQIVGATSLDGEFGAGEAVNNATFNGTTTAEKSLTTANKFFKAVIVEKTAE